VWFLALLVDAAGTTGLARSRADASVAEHGRSAPTAIWFPPLTCADAPQKIPTISRSPRKDRQQAGHRHQGRQGQQKALEKGGITLTKLPSGTYKINVTATTVLKQKLTGSQTYKACTVGSGDIGLKGRKKHHGE
jgi:hypothetical protein